MNTNRKTLSVVLISLLLFLVVSLTWLSLRRESIPPSIRATFTPAPGFNVTIPQKGLLKNYLTVSVEAAPGTNCTLTFIPPSGETQVMEAVANADGECAWRWKLEESYGKGDARLIFTIDGVSDTHFIEIRDNF